MADFHQEVLRKHCRICAKALAKFKVRYSCADRCDKLEKTFGVAVSGDSPDVHPVSFCHGCYDVLVRSRKAKEANKLYTPSVELFSWSPHTGNCTVCDYFKKASSGGRPRKQKIGRPSASSTRSAIMHLHTTAPPTFFNAVGVHSRTLQSTSSVSISDLVCPLCSLVVDRPIQFTTCNKLVCLNCLCSSLSNNGFSCPCCGGDHLKDHNTMVCPSPVVMKIIGDLLVSCVKCNKQVVAAKYQQHVDSNCMESQESASSSVTTIQDVLAKSPDSPLTPQEMKLTTSLVRRRLSETPNGTGILEVKTRGQPLTFLRVSKPRVDSGTASKETIRVRTAEITKHRHLTSGGADIVQLQDEVRVCSSAEREQILSELHNGGFKVEVPVTQILGMKADLNIPWTKLREVRRWFRVWGVSFASEGKMRVRAKELVEDHLVGEHAPFSFPLKEGGEDVRTAPYVYVSSLWAKVLALLDQHERNDSLSWHDGKIPLDEIWLKVGGDKGGDTFKMVFQVVNAKAPNSPANTCVFSIFEAPDSVTNLKVVGDRFGQEIADLEKQTWKGKTIKVFLCGDYEFLTRMYGLSGASGRHCCLWCHVSSSQLATSPSIRGAGSLRTNATLERDLKAFEDDGGNIKKAKEFNNVIRKSFVPLDLQKVCPPSLHISLGIFFRLFTLLEDACHELDVLASLQQTSATAGSSFTKYREALQRQSNIRDSISTTKTQISCLEQILTLTLVTVPPGALQNSLLQQTASEITVNKKKIGELESEMKELDKVVKKSFSRNDGPFVSGLDKALSSFYVERQAYYSGTFVGNHVHRCLKEKNIDTICTSVLSTALLHYPSLHSQAQQVAERFRKAFVLFRDCNNLYEKNYVNDDEIEQLSESVKTFMSYYRQQFPMSSVTPKMHMLEEHLVPWLRRWKVGFGLLGEQGAESIHAYFNSLKRTYCGIPDKLKRLKQMMTEHHLHIAPDNIAIRPHIKKRKMTDVEE